MNRNQPSLSHSYYETVELSIENKGITYYSGFIFVRFFDPIFEYIFYVEQEQKTFEILRCFRTHGFHTTAAAALASFFFQKSPKLRDPYEAKLVAMSIRAKNSE